MLRTAVLLLLLVLALPASAAEAVPWPRVMPFPAAEGSPWSVSPPAGIDREGFVRVEDGHFRTDAGRIRLFGINQSFSAMFPGREDAVRLADQFARLGFNAVRVVSIDHVAGGQPWAGLWGADQEGQRAFDPDQLDRFDHFLHQLRLRGIRVVLCLHFNRRYPATGLVDPAELAEARIKYSKGVDQLDAEMIAAQRRFAADLLRHVNPWTGKAYVDDPMVALVEVNNENSVYAILWHKGRLGRLPARLLAHLDQGWRAHLEGVHGTLDALRAAWGPSAGPASAAAVGLPPADGGWEGVGIPRADPRGLPAPVQRDLAAFLRAREAAYWDGQIRFLKEDLGVRVPISGTQMAFTWQDFGRRFDYVDAHAYWHHPEFPSGEWDPDTATVRNQSMVASPSNSLVARLASARMAGKPFVVGEYNHPWPNAYRAEGVPMLAVMAALQDWDGIFYFNFMNGIADQQRIDFFCFNNSFLRLHALPFAALAFRDGLVAPFAAGRTIPLRVDEAVASAIADQPLPLRSRHPLPHALAAAARVGIEIVEDGPGLAAGFPSADPDPRLDWRPQADHRRYREAAFALDDPRAKAWIGWPGEAGIRLDRVALEGIRTASGWCVFTLVARDGMVGAPGRHLLTLAADAAYEGVEVVDRQRGNQVLGAGDHHGRLIGPRLLRRDRVHQELVEIPVARVRLRVEPGRRAEVRAIGADGVPAGEPLVVDEAGDERVFSIGGLSPARSLCYAIDIR